MVLKCNVGRRPTVQPGSLPARETEGREALRAGKRVMRELGTRKGRIEPGRAKGVRGSLATERPLSRKSGPRIKSESLPYRPGRTECPVAEWVAW